MKSLVRTVAPAIEPVSLIEAKAFLRVTDDEEDAQIASLITTAVEFVENQTGRALIEQTWRLTMSSWPVVSVGNYYCEPSSIITLQRSPLLSVASVKYYPADEGAQETLDSGSYYVLADAEPGMIVLKSAESWPDLFDRPDAVEVIFTAGVAAAADVPAVLRHAVLLAMVHFYENRGPVDVTQGSNVTTMPYSLKHILESQRVGGWIA